MKVWITRGSAYTMVARGAKSLTMWFSRPVFDRSVRGAADPIYAHQAIGWTSQPGVEQVDGRDRIVSKGSKDAPALRQVWEHALGEAHRALRALGSNAGPDWDLQALLELPEDEQSTFCLELTLDAAASFAVTRRLIRDSDERVKVLLAQRTGNPAHMSIPF